MYLHTHICEQRPVGDAQTSVYVFVLAFTQHNVRLEGRHAYLHTYLCMYIYVYIRFPL